MVQAPDLSRAEYQRGVTDAALALSIRQGKGKMPKFELSDPVVAALVQKVRSFAR
jgi:cytochrome c oxidase cbb3-type subunit 3